MPSQASGQPALVQNVARDGAVLDIGQLPWAMMGAPSALEPSVQAMAIQLILRLLEPQAACEEQGRAVNIRAVHGTSASRSSNSGALFLPGPH